MRMILTLGAAVLCGIVAGSTPAGAGEAISQTWASQNLTSLPLVFTENAGQWDEQALFRADAGRATIWITGEGVVYQFVRPKENSENPADFVDESSLGRRANEVDEYETLIVRARLVGAAAKPTVSGNNPIGYKCNYFHGNNPAQWRTNVPNYQSVVLKGVYPGIDLKYYGNRKNIEYDFVVSPGADYSQIKLQYEGAENVNVAADGSLTIATAWGEIGELAPVVYQVVDGRRKAVSASYEMADENTFGFRLGSEYDRSLPVTIDPELDFSTYLGGSAEEYCYGVAVDENGNAYVCGRTYSSDFPLANAYDDTLSGIEVFVSKISAEGDSLEYSTYLGGANSDRAFCIAVSSSGHAYVGVETASSDYPTLNAYQSSFQGGTWDVAVTKISTAGDSLEFSTFLGGTGSEIPNGIAVDASGCAYVTGMTTSTDYPTSNQYQTDQTGDDAFVTKLSSSGSSLGYSTYLGGNGADAGVGIAVDASGAAYVTGSTGSSDFPTSNAYQGDQTGTDAFVTKLSAAGNSLTYSTYLGGSASDVGEGIAVDPSGAAYVTGSTGSSDFPFVNGYSAWVWAVDAFVAKLDASGSSLVYSTCLGGTFSDYAEGIAVDDLGTAYIVGQTTSSNFPTVNEFQSKADSVDTFVARLSGNGKFPIYSTFLGGDSCDWGYAIALDSDGSAYVAGFTKSTDFPTADAYQSSYQGGPYDAFLTKIEAVSCCLGRVGDANQSGGDEPTIGDVNALINALFYAETCDGVLYCLEEADVNQSGGSSPTCDDITIGDIAYLQNYLFGSPPPTLPDCQ